MNHNSVRRSVLALLAVVAWSYACGDRGTEPLPPETSEPASLTITPSNASLTAVGATAQMTADVRDQNGKAVVGAAVTWMSSDASVATVNAGGLVAAASNGTATVTATSGGVSGTAVVTVAQAVAAVEMAPGSATLTALGDTLRLTAEASDANGHAVAGVPAVWSSGAPDVAVVGSTGLLTARSNGTATVTATAGGMSGSATVTVAQAVAAVEMAPGSATLTALGDTLRLTAEASDANGHAVAGAAIGWASSDASVAAVDASGMVTAAANGSATIAATAGSVSGTAAVTVAQVVSAVAMSPAADTLVAFGDTLRMLAEATDANGHGVAGPEFSWSSSDTLVALVDASGLVMAAANGSATVTAMTGGVSGSATVMVAQAVAAVEIAPGSATLTALGDTLRLTAEASDANGHAVAGVPAVWSSGAPDVAVVGSTGLLTARSNGTATVTATAGGMSGSATVTVAQAVAAVVLDRDSMTLAALGFWDGGSLWARLTDANGHVVVGVPVVWSSDADSVAAVESAVTEGLGPGRRPVDEFSFALVTTGWEGTATVTATAGGVSDSAVVTVLSPHCAREGASVECRYDVVVGRLLSPLWGNPAVITAADPSRLGSVAYAGRGLELFLFTAHFGSHTMEVKAPPGLRYGG